MSVWAQVTISNHIHILKIPPSCGWIEDGELHFLVRTNHEHLQHIQLHLTACAMRALAVGIATAVFATSEYVASHAPGMFTHRSGSQWETSFVLLCRIQHSQLDSYLAMWV